MNLINEIESLKFDKDCARPISVIIKKKPMHEVKTAGVGGRKPAGT